MLHGTERYEIDGQRYEGGLLPAAETASSGLVSTKDPVATPDALQDVPVRKFCRLFPKATSLPDVAALVELGAAMETEHPESLGPDSTIAAGFTYLGQFIDHDITFDQSELTTTSVSDPVGIQNHRSPALDLDSVYGGGPAVNPALYEADGARFHVGDCSESADKQGKIIPEIPNDLFRKKGASTAVIGDRRNDENLALAQMHVAFLKFHNSFVDQMRAEQPALDASRLFAKARAATIEHYQRIVLQEFLPRIIDPNALEFVLSSGHRFFDPAKHDQMPIEFSVAAFRLGHSMIRPVYEWNRVFGGGQNAIAPATLQLLFEFTEFSGRGQPFGGRSDRLPSNWAVDWRLMFDVVGNPPPAGVEVNRARPIDTQMTAFLKDLPEFHQLKGKGLDPLLSLATRNLLRGRMLELPDGLTVAREIATKGLPHQPLTKDQLRGGPHGPVLEQVGLLDAPPLWYYILREAELQMERLPGGRLQGGARLGPVGSAIVAETIVAHIRKADVSILANGTIRHIHQVPPYTMSDLLLRVNDLNPVG